jgi:hypothetical protein
MIVLPGLPKDSFSCAPISRRRDRFRVYFPCARRGGADEARDRWGSPEFIGLGFLSFVSILLTELFGSPFMKNISIIIGLVVGCIVAGAAGYIDGSSIKTAPAITFLWFVRFLIVGQEVRADVSNGHEGCIHSRSGCMRRPSSRCLLSTVGPSVAVSVLKLTSPLVSLAMEGTFLSSFFARQHV